MEHEKPFSGSSINTDSEFRSDWNSQLYCIINKTFPLSQIVYRIDLENMNATKVFQLNTIESDITIGKSEFAFQKAYWMPVTDCIWKEGSRTMKTGDWIPLSCSLLRMIQPSGSYTS